MKWMNFGISFLSLHITWHVLDQHNLVAFWQIVIIDCMTWASLHTCQRQLQHLPSLQPHQPFQLFFNCDRWRRYHLLLSWPFSRMGQAASTWEMLKYWIPYSWSATRTLKTFRSRCFKRILIHSRSPNYTGNVFFQKWHNLGSFWKVSCIFFHWSRGVYLLTLYFFSLDVIVTYHVSSRRWLISNAAKFLETKGRGACQQIWNPASWYCSYALEKTHWH
jgi:hypothetical protein